MIEDSGIDHVHNIQAGAEPSRFSVWVVVRGHMPTTTHTRTATPTPTTVATRLATRVMPPSLEEVLVLIVDTFQYPRSKDVRAKWP